MPLPLPTRWTVANVRRGLFVAREFHMCQLNLPAGKLFLDVQVEAYKRKGQFDRLVTFGNGLRAKSIDDVLMNKRWIAVRERVVA